MSRSKVPHGHHRDAVRGRQAQCLAHHGLLQRRDRRTRTVREHEKGALHRHGTAAQAALSEAERRYPPLRSRKSVHQHRLPCGTCALRGAAKSQRRGALLRQCADGELFCHAQEGKDLSDRGLQAAARAGQNDHFSLCFRLLQPHSDLHPKPAGAAARAVSGVDGSATFCCGLTDAYGQLCRFWVYFDCTFLDCSILAVTEECLLAAMALY